MVLGICGCAGDRDLDETLSSSGADHDITAGASGAGELPAIGGTTESVTQTTSSSSPVDAGGMGGVESNGGASGGETVNPLAGTAGVTDGTSTGGAQATGGVILTGGVEQTGGNPTGGVSTGGAQTGGAQATGGVSTGGSNPTGGLAQTGGSEATGGAAETGGTLSTGGAGTGGSSMAGAAGNSGAGGAPPECTLIDCYMDRDGDGYGLIHDHLAACDCPEGYVDNSSDYGDNNPKSFPGSGEIYGDTTVADCENGIEGWIPQCYVFKNGGNWYHGTLENCDTAVAEGAIELDRSYYMEVSVEWPDDSFVVIRFTVPDCNQYGLWSPCINGLEIVAQYC